ncbi:MAG: alcohol dehydrogenase [Planctomycetes bacterium]|nr:alcohol dehydrogenase [Planctomycetota bacterium]
MRSTITRVILASGLFLLATCSKPEDRPLVTGPPVALADAGTAPYWPGFLGPRGDNMSDETGLLPSWPADGPKLLWTAEGIGEGYSSVSLARGLIFTAGNINDKSVVTALDLAGQVQWQVPVGGAWTGSHPGTRGTPTIDEDRIYYQNPLGELSCLTASDGKPIWTVNVLERFGAPNITWALAESILVDGNRVISTPGGPRTAVVALDKRTGETVWQSPSAEGDAAGYATPALVQHEGKRLVFTFTAKAIICVDADTGKLYWRFPHETSYDVNALKPIFHEGRLFVSSGYGTGSRMLKVDVAGDEVKVAEVWTNRDLDNHHGGVLLRDGYLYGAAFGRNWVCLEWATGRTMYAQPGVGKGSATYADGMLYTLSEKMEMGLIAASPEKFQVVSRFRLPSKGDGPSWAYPVVCDGRLYLRHDNYLFCYDVHKSSGEQE